MGTEEVLQGGRLVTQASWLSLPCGPLEAAFDPASGSLRYLRVAGREVVRGIYVAVRDRNWNTITPVLSNLDLQTRANDFTLTFDVTCREREIDFVWHGEIAGNAAGTLSFTMEGEARTTFLRNRIGFCVLHPARECAGQPCLVEKKDGAIENGVFPKEISPHQPFLNIRALSHAVVSGLRAEVRFAGDTFEMEDQRNWTDASYKTYCTPLALPYPAEIQAGTRLRQSVTVTLQGRPRSPIKPARDSSVVLRWKSASAARKLPRIGLGMADDVHALTETEIERLRALNLAHLRVDLRLSNHERTGDFWLTRLRRAHAEIVSRLGAKMECAIYLAGKSEAANRADLMTLWYQGLDSIKSDVARALIFREAEKSTSGQWLKLSREIFSRTGRLRFPLFGGANAYFAELNRQRPPVTALDGVCWSINPQVHAFDNASLVENLEGQAWTVRSARALYGRKRIAISPVTLKPRFNPDATAATQTPEGVLPDSVDTRQGTLFGAGWTLGSLKTLAESGAESVTYYETVGWRGVMEQEAGSPLPEKFPSFPGAVFPLYHVLADVGEFRGGYVLPIVSADSLRIEAMTLQKEDRAATLVANLTDAPQTFRLNLPPSCAPQRIRQLDASNVEFAMRHPERFRAESWQSLEASCGVIERELPPYAVARLDYKMSKGNNDVQERVGSVSDGNEFHSYRKFTGGDEMNFFACSLRLSVLRTQCGFLLNPVCEAHSAERHRAKKFISSQCKTATFDRIRMNFRRKYVFSSLLFLSVLASLLCGQGNCAKATPKAAGIPVRFTLEKPGYVTLVVEDAAGNRVCNLLGETYFPAGQQTVYWDGYDAGTNDAKGDFTRRRVAMGLYHIRGIVHDRLTMRYEFSVNSPGTPPWKTKDGTGGWLADHSPPADILYLPDGNDSPYNDGKAQFLVCSTSGESGEEFVWLNAEGRRLAGINTGFWGGTHLCRDKGKNALPDYYAYVFTSGERDPDNNTMEARGFQKQGRLATILKLNFPPNYKQTIMPQFKTTDEAYGANGVAACNGIIVFSITRLNKLVFVDARQRKQIGEVSLPSPRGLDFDSQGRLYVITGKQIKRFTVASNPAKLREEKTLIADGLEAPRRLRLDDADNLLVSDWGKSHQIKIFTPEGKRLRTIGKSGGPQLGRYDEERLSFPAGVSADSQGQCWATEAESFPKRLSLWKADGKLLKAWYGTPKYGGGGAIDPHNKTRFYYAEYERGGGTEFALDWTNGTYKPRSVYWRPERFDESMPGPAPEVSFYKDGYQFLTNCYNGQLRYNQDRGIGIWRMEKDNVARPVVIIANAADFNHRIWGFPMKNKAAINALWKGQDLAHVMFIWCDKNGDHVAQTEEIQYAVTTRRDAQGNILEDMGLMPLVHPDLSITTSYGTWIAPPQLDRRGTPIYDLTKIGRAHV